MPAIVLILVVGVAVVLIFAAFSTWQRKRAVAVDGETPADPGPWHRHVSPLFFLLLVAAGVMIGFAVVSVALNFVN